MVNDVTVYTNRIFELVDEYIINDLQGNTDILSKGACFNGLLKYLYINLFKPVKGEKILYNAKSNIDTSNVELLDDIWNIYTSICYKYNRKPGVLGYCLLTGINYDTVNTWKNKEYRTNSSHSEVVKSWLKESELNLMDEVANNNSVGSMFLLKAAFGYTEAPQRLEITNGQTPDAVATDIANRRLTGDMAMDMPDMPDIER